MNVKQKKINICLKSNNANHKLINQIQGQKNTYQCHKLYLKPNKVIKKKFKDQKKKIKI